MIKKFVAMALSITLVLLLPEVHAAPKAADKAGQSVSQGPRRHLATIVFAGLAGAMLGLSTLSFYGRPQDRLSNIAVGFAIGVIGGAVYTTYKAATEPKDFYSLNYREAKPEVWRLAEISVKGIPPPALKTGLTFEF